MKEDILKGVIKHIIILSLGLLISECSNNELIDDLGKICYNKSLSVVSKEKYDLIYRRILDSLNNWSKNKLSNYQYCGDSKKCFLDSLICFNKSGDKFIGSILSQQLLSDGVADNVEYFYGININSIWYFYSGSSYHIPREMIKNQPINQPLSYEQLHEQALENIYKGYLKLDGSINEKWFDSHFSDWFYQDPITKEYNYNLSKATRDTVVIAACKADYIEIYEPYTESDFTLEYYPNDTALSVILTPKTIDTIYLKTTQLGFKYKSCLDGRFYNENTEVIPNWRTNKGSIKRVFKKFEFCDTLVIKVQQHFFPYIRVDMKKEYKFIFKNGKYVPLMNDDFNL